MCTPRGAKDEDIPLGVALLGLFILLEGFVAIFCFFLIEIAFDESVVVLIEEEIGQFFEETAEFPCDVKFIRCGHHFLLSWCFI